MLNSLTLRVLDIQVACCDLDHRVRAGLPALAPMPLLQPPASDLRASELIYRDAYNSIVSRVRRSGGSGSAGVVILVGVDVVGVILLGNLKTHDKRLRISDSTSL